MSDCSDAVYLSTRTSACRALVVAGPPTALMSQPQPNPADPEMSEPQTRSTQAPPRPRSKPRRPRPPEELRRRLGARALVRGSPFTLYRLQGGRWTFGRGDATVRAAWVVTLGGLCIVAAVAAWLKLRTPPVVERLSRVVKLEPAPIRNAPQPQARAAAAPKPASPVAPVAPLTVQMGTAPAGGAATAAAAAPPVTGVNVPFAAPPVRLRLDAGNPRP